MERKTRVILIFAAALLISVWVYAVIRFNNGFWLDSFGYTPDSAPPARTLTAWTILPNGSEETSASSLYVASLSFGETIWKQWSVRNPNLKCFRMTGARLDQERGLLRVTFEAWEEHSHMTPVKSKPLYEAMDDFEKELNAIVGQLELPDGGGDLVFETFWWNRYRRGGTLVR